MRRPIPQRRSRRTRSPTTRHAGSGLPGLHVRPCLTCSGSLKPSRSNSTAPIANRHGDDAFDRPPGEQVQHATGRHRDDALHGERRRHADQHGPRAVSRRQHQRRDERLVGKFDEQARRRTRGRRRARKVMPLHGACRVVPDCAPSRRCDSVAPSLMTMTTFVAVFAHGARLRRPRRGILRVADAGQAAAGHGGAEPRARGDGRRESLVEATERQAAATAVLAEQVAALRASTGSRRLSRTRPAATSRALRRAVTDAEGRARQRGRRAAQRRAGPLRRVRQRCPDGCRSHSRCSTTSADGVTTQRDRGERRHPGLREGRRLPARASTSFHPRSNRR